MLVLRSNRQTCGGDLEKWIPDWKHIIDEWRTVVEMNGAERREVGMVYLIYALLIFVTYESSIEESPSVTWLFCDVFVRELELLSLCRV